MLQSGCNIPTVTILAHRVAWIGIILRGVDVEGGEGARRRHDRWWMILGMCAKLRNRPVLWLLP